MYICILKIHFPRPTNYRNQFRKGFFPGIEKTFSMHVILIQIREMKSELSLYSLEPDNSENIIA